MHAEAAIAEGWPESATSPRDEGARRGAHRRPPFLWSVPLIEHYEIEREVGRGGMGIVYRARHALLQKVVAIKVLRPELTSNEEFASRFLAEARAAVAVRNEHVVDVVDFGELDDGTPYFIMEWLEGCSLREVLQREGRLEQARALEIAAGIGEAVSAAHRAGIFHRDLKPDNVFLVERSGHREFVKVLDFGIAKLTQQEQGYETRRGAVVGTPCYMSPEQARGLRTGSDHRTDLYALGVLVYEMVTGVLPFEGESDADVLYKQTNERPVPPSRRNGALDSRLDEMIDRALAKEPDERPASVEELLAVMREIGAPGDRQTSPWTATVPPGPVRRARAVEWTLAFCLGAVLSAGGFLVARPGARGMAASLPTDQAAAARAAGTSKPTHPTPAASAGTAVRGTGREVLPLAGSAEPRLPEEKPTSAAPPVHARGSHDASTVSAAARPVRPEGEPTRHPARHKVASTGFRPPPEAATERPAPLRAPVAKTGFAPRPPPAAVRLVPPPSVANPEAAADDRAMK